MIRTLLLIPAAFILLFVSGSAWAEGPPAPIWQEGPEGPVYGPSPLHLHPAAIIPDKGIVRLPDRVAFASGRATLDDDGMAIVLMQGQRLRQLPDHSVTLFCGWSAAEERWLGLTAAHLLASDRCRTVIDVYRSMKAMPDRFYAERLVPPDATVDEELQRSVSITVVGREGAREVIVSKLGNPIGEYNGRYGPHGNPQFDYQIQGYLIFVPEFIHFRPGSAEFTYNARAILETVADALTPGQSDYFLWPRCSEVDLESVVAPQLAMRRCQAMLDFLFDHGLCKTRVWMSREGPAVYSGLAFLKTYDYTDFMGHIQLMRVIGSIGPNPVCSQ